MTYKRNTHQIRVSNEVYQEIQSRATPLEDNVDAVLRKVFKLPHRKAVSRRKLTTVTEPGVNTDGIPPSQ